MGLSWQQGPLSPGAIGRFLVPAPLPKRPLYVEPLRPRMRVRFGGTWIADSENDEIVKVAEAKERMTVAEINAIDWSAPCASRRFRPGNGFTSKSSTAASHPLLVSSPHRRELRIYPWTMPTPVHWYRSRAVVLQHTGIRRPIRAFWNWPKRAMFRSVGRAGPAFVTVVRVVWFLVKSSTDRSHWRTQPTATFSFAAHN